MLSMACHPLGFPSGLKSDFKMINFCRPTRFRGLFQIYQPSPLLKYSESVLRALGTNWFTWLNYTTGTVQVIANTIGTPLDDFSVRTEMGHNTLTTTPSGRISGELLLVSGSLLQSRGSTNHNFAHTNATLIKFTPEPGSAALIAVGALGLIGLVAHDRRRNRT